MESSKLQLLSQLKDPRAEVRVAAAGALGKLEMPDVETIPPLVAVLHDVEREVRLAAVTSLIRIWRGLTGLLSDFLSSSDDIDSWFESIAPALQEALRDDDKVVRLTAAEGLREMFCDDQEIFDEFVKAARDPDETLRKRAALALWLGASDRRAPLTQVESALGIDVLLELLRDESKSVRLYALRTVASVGESAAAAIPILQQLLKEKDPGIRFNAALALAGTGEGEAALPILAETLINGDRLKRKAAAFVLRAMGPLARPALPALINGLRDQEKRVRSRCAGTIGRLGTAATDDAIHALLAAERDDDPDVRRAATKALAIIGRERVQTAQKLAAEFEAGAFFPLFGFKPEEIPSLIFMLKDANSNIRAMAATALGHLGAREAIPDLMKLLHDQDEDVRRRAGDTLLGMGIQPNELDH